MKFVGDSESDYMVASKHITAKADGYTSTYIELLYGMKLAFEVRSMLTINLLSPSLVQYVVILAPFSQSNS